VNVFGVVGALLLFDDASPSDSQMAKIIKKPVSQILFERELKWLRPDEIEEVRYISCDDFAPDVTQRNVIWVVTKRGAANARNRKG
jgi:hypothetical protein